jgi:hypothetical protein
VPTTVLTAKTVIAAGVLALTATGTAVAFASPASRPDQATARVAAAQAHRVQHAAGTAAHKHTMAPTASTSVANAGKNTSRDRSASSKTSHPARPTLPATSSAGRTHTVSAQAFGFCTAFTHGGLAPQSRAYTSLVKAAGGATHIRSYCAGIAHPGNPGGTSTSPPTASHPAATPTPHPTVKPADPGHKP